MIHPHSSAPLTPHILNPSVCDAEYSLKEVSNPQEGAEVGTREVCGPRAMTQRADDIMW